MNQREKKDAGRGATAMEPCKEGLRLFNIAWNGPSQEHGKLHANYLEHIINCKECITNTGLTTGDIKRTAQDIPRLRQGALIISKLHNRKQQQDPGV